MKRSSRGDPLDVVRGVVFLLVGLALVLGMLFEARSTLNFNRRALHAQGTVIRLNAGGSHPEIQFRTRGGQTIEFPQGGMIARYAPGQQVSVLYDPDWPRSVTLNTFGAQWGFTVMSFLMGLVFAGAGWFILRAYIRARDAWGLSARPGR